MIVTMRTIRAAGNSHDEATLKAVDSHIEYLEQLVANYDMTTLPTTATKKAREDEFTSKLELLLDGRARQWDEQKQSGSRHWKGSYELPIHLYEKKISALIVFCQVPLPCKTKNPSLYPSSQCGLCPRRSGSMGVGRSSTAVTFQK